MRRLNDIFTGRSNKRFDRSGISSDFIEDLNGFAVVLRPVNLHVRPLRYKTEAESN